MKKIALSLGIAVCSLACATVNAQTEVPVKKENAAAPTSNAEISFNKEVHDYGKIEKGGNGVCEFVFTNTGTDPLIISKARGSCGCTVPTWPKEPIAPGASSSIKVKYDTKRVGPINKSVTLTSNAKNSPTKVLRIKGTVKKAPDLNPKATPVGPVAN